MVWSPDEAELCGNLVHISAVKHNQHEQYRHEAQCDAEQGHQPGLERFHSQFDPKKGCAPYQGSANEERPIDWTEGRLPAASDRKPH